MVIPCFISQSIINFQNFENVSDEVLIEEDEESDEEEEKKKDPKSCWERVSNTVTSKRYSDIVFACLIGL